VITKKQANPITPSTEIKRDSRDKLGNAFVFSVVILVFY